MDPVSLIVLALAAGAGAGLKDTAAQAVKDAYGGLKSLARRRLHGQPDGELVLDRHETSPKTWAAPLAEALTGAGAGQDPELIAAARALLRLTDPAGSQQGKYQVLVTGSSGVMVGDHNVQHNQFGAPPGR
jgi:hypothetical protein